ncbi:MAG TPA: M20/M25/M40 family metallo-hydrolase [Mesorhizobium sp.]|jgi:arginine utilization protein RocB|nr:M20/M25/M40 family metallo-hydrolase [Mesorhizobium sp.]
MAEAARDWALLLTRQPSVTGSADEALFAPWLAERLNVAFGARAEVWTEAVAESDPRQNVFMLLRGGGPRTLVLTGHFDTVTTDDYAELKPLATEPERLLPALLAKLEAKTPRAPAEERALDDLASGRFLPGRGLLDMKAGLAAGLALCEEFARTTGATGNLLFLAVPDEEANSAGARGAAAVLGRVARERRLELVGAVNLDSIADDTDGANGRVVAEGTVGKLLPTAFVVGVSAHAGFPLNGLSAGVIAASIASRVEWAGELTDDGANGGPRTPPSLLSLHDGKRGYDVTTPGTGFATFNVLTTARSPAEILDAFDRLCAQAAAELLERLRGRIGTQAESPRLIDRLPDIPVIRFADVLARVEDRAGLAAAANDAALGGATLPDQCWAITQRAWELSGLTGPAIVTGFGSTPYLATSLSGVPQARRLAQVSENAIVAAGKRFGIGIRKEPFFAGISDMSFLGEGDAGALDLVTRNTPAFALVEGGSPVVVAGIPVVNAGPWGRDYHTPLERLETTYAFEILPELLAAIAAEMLEG